MSHMACAFSVPTTPPASGNLDESGNSPLLRALTDYERHLTFHDQQGQVGNTSAFCVAASRAQSLGCSLFARRTCLELLRGLSRFKSVRLPSKSSAMLWKQHGAT